MSEAEQLRARFARVRDHYRRHHAEIMASADDWFDDAYSWDHEAGIRLTPIEQGLWHDIRAEGLVMYPPDFEEVEDEYGRLSVRVGAARLFIRGIADRHPYVVRMAEARTRAQGFTLKTLAT